MNNLYQDIIYIKTKQKQAKGTIMFIHGFSSSYFLHYNFQESFDPSIGYNYLAINLPGHQFNENSNNIKDYNFNSYIDFIYGYIIEENIDNLIIIGHSMGGGIAMFLAEKIPERIKKIILVSAINSSIFVSKIGLDFLNSLSTNSNTGIEKIEFYNYKNFNNPQLSEYIKYEINRLLKNKKKYIHLGAQLLDPTLYIKLDKIYKKNKIPTLYLIGEFDKVIPYQNTIKYFKQLKNPRTIIKTIAQAGHVSFVDNFNEYLEYIWWFINL